MGNLRSLQGINLTEYCMEICGHESMTMDVFYKKE